MRSLEEVYRLPSTLLGGNVEGSWCETFFLISCILYVQSRDVEQLVVGNGEELILAGSIVGILVILTIRLCNGLSGFGVYICVGVVLFAGKEGVQRFRSNTPAAEVKVAVSFLSLIHI